MIFKSEVDDILGGNMPQNQVLDCIQHYEIGGFHSSVDEKSRQALREWLTNNRPMPDQMAQPVERQLDLLEGDA